MPSHRMSRSRRDASSGGRRWWASVALVLGLVAAACSSGGNAGLISSAEPGSGPLVSGPPATSSPAFGGSAASDGNAGDASGRDTKAPAVAFDVDAVEWRACGDVDCADLEVPLDYSDPSGSTITIAMTRLPSTGTTGKRLGSIFVNFGGPGAEGTETIQSFGSYISDDLRDRFDIVSFDPRGVEDTSGLGCDGEIGDEPTTLIDPEDGFADDVAADRVVWERVMACAATSPIIDDLGTIAVANDLEMMRRAVGDEALTYLGLSYGTQIGWVYATLYPGSVRAMVLDGAVPPLDGLADQTFGQMVAIEAAIARWDQGCSQSPDCPLRDEGYENSLLRLMDELEADPIPRDDGTTFGPVDLGQLAISMTYRDQVGWGPTFVEAVAALDAGDPEPMLGLAAALDGGFEEATFWSVLCADGSGSLADGDDESMYRQAFELSPIMGQLPGGIFCDSFPGEIDGLPTLDTAGTPPLLVIGNTGDNATPYGDAVVLDQLLTDSVLLTYDGPGHTITFFDDCVDAVVVDYFVELAMPPVGTRCGNQSTTPNGWFVPIDD